MCVLPWPGAPHWTLVPEFILPPLPTALVACPQVWAVVCTTDRRVLPLVLELELTLLFILKLGAFRAQRACIFVLGVQVEALEKVPALWPFLSFHCYLH